MHLNFPHGNCLHWLLTAWCNHLGTPGGHRNGSTTPCALAPSMPSTRVSSLSLGCLHIDGWCMTIMCQLQPQHGRCMATVGLQLQTYLGHLGCWICCLSF